MAPSTSPACSPAWTRWRACGGCGSRRPTRSTSTPRWPARCATSRACAPISTCPCSPDPTASSPRCAAATRDGNISTRSRSCATTCPTLALTTDVIVGYPGETEAEFEATVSLIEEVGFDGVFVFMYSPRPGTTAFRLADDVPAAEKLRRLQVVNALQQRAQERQNRARIGRREEVLVDTVAASGRVAGRTRDFRIVHLDGGADLLGRTIEVDVTAAGPNALLGSRPAANPSLTPPSARSYILTSRGAPRGGRHADRDEHQGVDDRPHHEHADHHPPRPGGPAHPAHLGGRVRGQRHRPSDRECPDSTADDARSPQEHHRRPLRAASSGSW